MLVLKASKNKLLSNLFVAEGKVLISNPILSVSLLVIGDGLCILLSSLSVHHSLLLWTLD